MGYYRTIGGITIGCVCGGGEEHIHIYIRQRKE